jgi:hypothetical protein
MIGEMARTFGCLPSEVDAKASTFDVMVYDVLMAWDQHKEDKKQGKISTPDIDEAQLMEIMKRAKG